MSCLLSIAVDQSPLMALNMCANDSGLVTLVSIDLATALQLHLLLRLAIAANVSINVAKQHQQKPMECL